MKQTIRLNPANYVIKVLGGTVMTAKILNRHHSTVWRWVDKKGGYIPSKARKEILQLSKKLNLDITSEDLDYGREIH